MDSTANRIKLVLVLLAILRENSCSKCTLLKTEENRVPNNYSSAGHTEASDSIAECGVKLHKHAKFTSAVFSQEKRCDFYSDIIPKENLTSFLGTSYIRKVCTAASDDCLCRKLSGEDSGSHQVIINGHYHQVFCDMVTDGGGWTVFQRRTNGSVDFYRDWNSYKSGFGDVESEHWLGNDLISALTARGPHELRVDLVSFTNESAFAKYSAFTVDSEINNYTLLVSGYSGTAGDSLGNGSKPYQVVNGQPFSTYDRDNDRGDTFNCAQHWHGAWWYNYCHGSHLNGQYLNNVTWESMVWESWKGNTGLKGSTMMLRPDI